MGGKSRPASIKELASAVKRLEQHVERLETELVKRVVKETVKELSGPDREDPLKNEVLKRFRRNRKELVQRKILEMVGSRATELPELKDIIVDNYRYCSKATFYRYFNELMAKKRVTIAEIESRTMVSSSQKNGYDLQHVV